MKTDIVLAGVGGQGILTIATILGKAALNEGLYLKQAEVHGMSQRGGDVQSNLRISDRPIHSDLIPQGGADLIVSLEPMESLRYLPYLKDEGWVVTNTNPFVNIDNYPAEESLTEALGAVPNMIAFNMDEKGKEMQASRSANMILLGAASPFIEIESSKIEDAIAATFARKGEKIVEQNIAAYRAGREFTENKLKG